MQIGIMAKTFARPSLEGLLEAVAAHGLSCVQFNLACVGWETMPERIDTAAVERVAAAFRARGIAIAALSGTFNLVHPHPGRRREGLRRLRLLASICACLGTPLITLCTGTRDPESMWRWHPDNDQPGTWRDLTASLREALAIAEEHQVLLGIEPEVNNVVSSAAKARRLLDELGSPRLKIIMDGANLFARGQLPRMKDVLDEAFALLGADIALAHAKDLSRDGDAGDEAAGTGLLDYEQYLRGLAASGFRGALILHSLVEDQVPGCVSFLRAKLAKLGPPHDGAPTGERPDCLCRSSTTTA
jgi:sugar phosphate isomerase/epimerase